jgi:hypothetical protein
MVWKINKIKYLVKHLFNSNSCLTLYTYIEHEFLIKIIGNKNESLNKI